MLVVRYALPLRLLSRGAREPGYLLDREERLGKFQGFVKPGALWIHAVSLGETRAAGILIDQLRRRHPGLRLLLTHSTATGRSEGLRWLQSDDSQAWLPLDTPKAVRLFLEHFRPKIGVLMETEVWPNLVEACQKFQVPLLLVNARLNEKSFLKAQKLAWLSQPAYAGLSAVYAQTDADASHLRHLGAHVEGVFGNLKFDIAAYPVSWAYGRALRAALGNCCVSLLASSREGEEALWLAAWLAQRSKGRKLTQADERRRIWLVVPRHPQRFDAVADMLAAAGLQVFRRSQLTDWDVNKPLPGEALRADVWLGDSLGEMPTYYGMADSALLGGSYLPLGGQNLVEAAACDCPIIMGPSTFNFAEAAEWALSSGAAVRVSDMASALLHVETWNNSPKARLLAVDGCRALLRRGAGAAVRYADAILTRLKVTTDHSHP